MKNNYETDVFGNYKHKIDMEQFEIDFPDCPVGFMKMEIANGCML